jgi:3-phenylpropionate/trans-cinnamate dioxygenase ferredoxin subunit
MRPGSLLKHEIQANRKMTTPFIEVCAVADMTRESVRRFDHVGKTFAVYCGPEGDFFATDGFCTHEKSHLADGSVDGHIIECSRHFGQFDYRTGEAVELPACVNLRTYPVVVREGKVFLDLSEA